HRREERPPEEPTAKGTARVEAPALPAPAGSPAAPPPAPTRPAKAPARPAPEPAPPRPPGALAPAAGRGRRLAVGSTRPVARTAAWAGTPARWRRTPAGRAALGWAGLALWTAALTLGLLRLFG